MANRGRARDHGGYFRPSGRSSRSTANSVHRNGPVGSDGSSGDVPLGQNDKVSLIGRQTSGQSIPDVKDISSNMGNLKLEQNSAEVVGSNTKQTDGLSASGSKFWKASPLLSAQCDTTDKHQNTTKTQRAQPSDGGSESHSPLNLVCCSAAAENEAYLLAESVTKDVPSKKETERGQTSHEKTDSTGRSENSDCQPVVATFDICRERTGSGVKLKAPLHVKNREKRNEIKRSMEGQDIVVLRNGMVLLKSYLSNIDQVKIIKRCRELGLGPGGFYQPEYRDGAKLHLKMMCLGKNWDPEISSYVELRLFDKAKPIVVPNEFNQLVKKAIEDSHAYLQKQYKERNVECVIPSMSPNICIVNFYANSGKLGLHQDKDESAASLRKGLPVVSFSIGDSAEFLYGDQRDVEKADKVILESGDVLIFGGESRHIFHGVRSIIPDSAPKALMEESNLRPGRLNLTFREY